MNPLPAAAGWRPSSVPASLVACCVRWSILAVLAVSTLGAEVTVGVGAGTGAGIEAGPGGGRGAGGLVSVIYCTDLFHPHEDPDDHFDLATMFSLPGIDLRGIVLDQGGRQLERPGRIPVGQLNTLSGRRVPCTIGLQSPLVSPSDPAVVQPEPFQGGVRMILETLRSATGRVDLVAVGSVRDVVAAFNREPALFRQRAGRVLVFIGEASNPEFREYNVGLDPQAFVGLMRSGLDVFWVPCFDGGLWQNRGRASFWQARHADLLERAPPELVQYFIYALEKETSDPLEFLRRPVDPGRRAALFGQTRNLWCTAVFRTLTAAEPAAGGGVPGLPFTFDALEATVTGDAVVRLGPVEGPEGGARRIRVFRVLDRERYAAVMTRATADLLARFPMAAR